MILRQREDGEYQLVSGFRRRKAAELAKLKELPALVYDMTEKEAMAYCEKRNAENWHTARSGTQKILRRSPES